MIQRWLVCYSFVTNLGTMHSQAFAHGAVEGDPILWLIMIREMHPDRNYIIHSLWELRISDTDWERLKKTLEAS